MSKVTGTAVQDACYKSHQEIVHKMGSRHRISSSQKRKITTTAVKQFVFMSDLEVARDMWRGIKKRRKEEQ